MKTKIHQEKKTEYEERVRDGWMNGWWINFRMDDKWIDGWTEGWMKNG